MRNKRKLLSLVMTVAMITSMFAGFTISASATNTDSWTDYSTTSDGSSTVLIANYDTSWYTGASSYSFSNAKQLAGLAAIVNGTAYKTTSEGYLIDLNNEHISNISNGVAINASTFSGVTITLTAPINLSGHDWIPIGGMCNVNSSYAPSGTKFFAGVFDGNEKTISNMTISASVSTSNHAAWGLFGLVKGGVLGNIILGSGCSVNISGSGEDIGGVVGYTTNSLYNCHNAASVTATGSSNTGGVAGCVENKTTTNVEVQYCSNTGAISAGTRMGGVLGASYTGTSNHIYIQYCYNEGNLSNNASGKKNYTGGIDGYACANISDCYNQGNITMRYSSDTCYAAGIAGILVDYNTQPSSLARAYSTATFTRYNINYARWLWASADYSSNVLIDKVYYVATNNDMTQPSGGTWGTVTNMGTISSYSDLTSTQLGTAFSYHTDKWPTLTSVKKILSPATGSSVEDDDNMIFLDPNAQTNGDGSKASPFNNLADATAANTLTASRNVIYMLDGLSVSANTTITSSVTNATIKRSCTYTDGPLFTVTSGTLTLGNIIIDGNADVLSESGDSLFLVSGGTLTIGNSSTTPMAILKNSYHNVGGGAITLNSGTVKMYSGAIRNCGSIYGGAALVSGGTFTLYGGTIGGSSANKNTAINGGAIKTENTGTFTMTGGEISYNKATRGGAIFAGAGNVTVSGGTIANNEARSAGSGVYVTTNPTISYGGSGIASGQVVYLANSDGIVAIELVAELTSDLTIACADASVDTIVAVGDEEYVTETSRSHIKYTGHTFRIDEDWGTNYIVINT